MTKKKTKIVFLMPSLVGGGAERTLINLLKRIDYDKYKIDLVLVCNTGEYVSQVPKEVTLITLFNNYLWVRIQGYLQKKVGFSYFFKSKMVHKVGNEYDVAISFLDSNFTDLLFYLDSSIKKYSWVHSSYVSYVNFAKFYKNENYRKKLIDSRYSKLDGIFFVSQDSKDEFIQTFGTFPRMEVIYNIIDVESVLLKSREFDVPKSEVFQFFALGSLIYVKGFDRLIRAAKIVRDRGFVFKIVIAGKGKEKDSLTNLIVLHSLESYVELIGFQNNPYPYLLKSDVFVMSSVSEALPTVLCEAMILGKPVLVTNCSGCRELVDEEKYGLMAEQDDNALAEKMIIYLSDSSLVPFYSKKSIERAEIFDDTKTLEKYYHIFDH